MEETETATTSFKKKHAICKTNNFYILLVFFINYYYGINSGWYLLLPDAI